MMTAVQQRKPVRSRFHRHVNTLIWKSYLQRQRRWRLLLLETLFAGVLFLIAVFIAKPVFLTPLQAEPERPLSSREILASLNNKHILGYAPNTSPYMDIMSRVAELLNLEVMSAPSESDLNNMLYRLSGGTPITNPVIWVIWKPQDKNRWTFNIRSTERARYATRSDVSMSPNPHLRSGFLSVQLAVDQALLEYTLGSAPKYELTLVSMPVSPLMQDTRVKRAISGILLCFTLALLPPVLETEALVVTETVSRFKRALRIRNVDFSSIYVAWLVYAYLSALPACFLAAVTLILIFRWIHLVYSLLLVLAYISVMILFALIMAMFQNKAWIACLWTTLFTFMQTFLAELLVHHQVDMQHGALTFLLHVTIPPLGLVHGFNEFALLQTGRQGTIRGESNCLLYTLLSWTAMAIIYFTLLMLLQRTVKESSIGGQVSWKSIIFKQVENVNKLRPIETPTGRERENLQEVDELVAKALCIRNVSKTIMGHTVLNNITLDIYRGEFTMLFAERVQENMIITLEDLLTGLTYADKGSVIILGEEMKVGKNLMATPHMMGYCHRSEFLIDDLTVEEHFIMYTNVCLWQESTQYVAEYGHIRLKRLLSECDLEDVRYHYIRNLSIYYRAQLCWAIALLLEPRIVIIPSSRGKLLYSAVIQDKIMQYKKYITVIKFCTASIKLEYADRVFIFDNSVLVFGGTPAYMFFKFGREYRVRISFRGAGLIDDENIQELVEKVKDSGATVRAHLGALLILRVPANPTANVVALVKDLEQNANKYGIMSMNICVPDTEEVCNRAIYESRSSAHATSASHHISRLALKRISEPIHWNRSKTRCGNITYLKNIGFKFYAYYKQYRFFLIITIISAIVTGIFIGLSLSLTLGDIERDEATKKILHGELLTVEAFEQKTTLVLRLDNSSNARSVAKAYVLSETGATEEKIERMFYTALPSTESIKEYLVTRAIDSPQHYVYMYAYGIDLHTKADGTLIVQVLYSPLHYDQGAAARSLARAYTALLRHYTGELDATIQVIDDPLALDLTPWLKHAASVPVLIQFLLILTISHITLIPSKEYGLVRYTQCHAMNFSPARYWFSLFLCDLILYGILVVLITGAMVLFMHLVAPKNFHYIDLVIVPFMLLVYGIGCIPQAYLFSLGPQAALNSMTFIIVNVVFGETTVIAKILYGNALDYALNFMSLSPQFNMAYAFVKIKQIFLYNSECIIFKNKNLCSSKKLHKCCPKCGVLQKCFSKKFYFTQSPGVLMEVTAIVCTAVVFMTVLLLWEYRLIQRLWTYIITNWIYPDDQIYEAMTFGARREKGDVLDKTKELRIGERQKIDTFGDCLLASDVTYKEYGQCIIRNVHLGVGRGEALAVSGLAHHGRGKLCEVLAGYKMPSEGQMWCMSRWKLRKDPHMYCRQVTLSCNRDPMPPWMTVYNALELIAILRGIPDKQAKLEVMNYIDALELNEQARTLISHLTPNDRSKLHFAAAVVGAPPVLILDECTAYQKYSVRRAMYYIMYHLRKRGHAILVSSSSVESHMPVASRLAILVDGAVFDVDQIDNLVTRYSDKGYTVVLHLKDEVDVTTMLLKYFQKFTFNDTSEVLVNVQVLDEDLTWSAIFERLEKMKVENHQVYAYIVSATPIDYIYNTILSQESGRTPAREPKTFYLKYCLPIKPMTTPSQETLDKLVPFKKQFDITKLNVLPWSVIFHR